jgi:hypothetical protein
MGPWVEYASPDDSYPISEQRTSPRRARRMIIPPDGDAFFVYGEWDDGNGMWTIIGVSRAN